LCSKNNISEIIDYDKLVEQFDAYLESHVDIDQEYLRVAEMEDLFIRFLFKHKPIKNYFELSKAYIIYVNDKDIEYTKVQAKIQKKIDNNKFKIIKSN